MTMLMMMLQMTANDDAEVKSTYIGESSRSAFQRGQEHLDGAHRGDPKNPLVRHAEDYHGMKEVVPPFRMEIARGFLKPLPRQICEAVAIEGGASGADMMLNSKAEWNGSRIPRLTVEVGATVNQQDFRGGAQVVRKLTNLWADNTLPPPARGREAPGPGPKPKRKRDYEGGKGGGLR